LKNCRAAGGGRRSKKVGEGCWEGVWWEVEREREIEIAEVTDWD